MDPGGLLGHQRGGEHGLGGRPEGDETVVLEQDDPRNPAAASDELRDLAADGPGELEARIGVGNQRGRFPQQTISSGNNRPAAKRRAESEQRRPFTATGWVWPTKRTPGSASR